MQTKTSNIEDDSFLVFFTKEEVSVIKKELNEKELSVFNVLLWMCKSESQRHLNNYSVTLSFGFNSISRWFDVDKNPTHYIYNRVRDVTIYRDDISDPVVFVKQFLEFCK